MARSKKYQSKKGRKMMKGGAEKKIYLSQDKEVKIPRELLTTPCTITHNGTMTWVGILKISDSESYPIQDAMISGSFKFTDNNKIPNWGNITDDFNYTITAPAATPTTPTPTTTPTTTTPTPTTTPTTTIPTAATATAAGTTATAGGKRKSKKSTKKSKKSKKSKSQKKSKK